MSYKETQDDLPDAAKEHRFETACRLLRNAGALDELMPGQHQDESRVDWFVRIGIAVDKYASAEALIIGKGLEKALDVAVAEKR